MTLDRQPHNILFTEVCIFLPKMSVNFFGIFRVKVCLRKIFHILDNRVSRVGQDHRNGANSANPIKNFKDSFDTHIDSKNSEKMHDNLFMGSKIHFCELLEKRIFENRQVNSVFNDTLMIWSDTLRLQIFFFFERIFIWEEDFYQLRLIKLSFAKTNIIKFM